MINDVKDVKKICEFTEGSKFDEELARSLVKAVRAYNKNYYNMSLAKRENRLKDWMQYVRIEKILNDRSIRLREQMRIRSREPREKQNTKILEKILKLYI